MAKVSISAKALVPHDCMNCPRHIRLAETWNQPPRGLLVKSVFPPNLQIKDEACVWRTMPTSWDSIFFFSQTCPPFFAIQSQSWPPWKLWDWRVQTFCLALELGHRGISKRISRLPRLSTLRHFSKMPKRENLWVVQFSHVQGPLRGLL